MNVLLIHEHGGPQGSGAVVAMWRLHEALRDLGESSTIACRKRTIEDPNVVELPRPWRAERLIQKLTWRLGLNDVHCLHTFGLPRFAPFADADVVNIHGWHTNYFNYLALPRLCRSRPIVATMHDVWHLTGHCAVPLDCPRWRTGCGRCPYLKSFPPAGRDATAIEWRLKRRSYRHSDMTVVAPSRHVVNMASEGLLGRFDIRQIPNPVDTAVYRPMDKNAARKALDLPPDGRVLLFGALSMSNPVKGGDLLVDSLRRLPDYLRRDTTLLLLGAGGEEIVDAARMRAVSLGYVGDDKRKTLAFNAADMFVLPSRWENQGIVLLEAMACGTPCIGYDAGGVAEVIESGPAGIVVPAEDTAAFADAIATLLTDDSLRLRLGEHARAATVREYDSKLHARRYRDLFEEVAARRAEREPG